MSLHINRFIDKLAGAEARQQRDLSLTIAEARGLHQDVTRLLMMLDALHTGNTDRQDTADTVEIKITGGTFKDT